MAEAAVTDIEVQVPLAAEEGTTEASAAPERTRGWSLWPFRRGGRRQPFYPVIRAPREEIINVREGLWDWERGGSSRAGRETQQHLREATEEEAADSGRESSEPSDAAAAAAAQGLAGAWLPQRLLNSPSGRRWQHLGSSRPRSPEASSPRELDSSGEATPRTPLLSDEPPSADWSSREATAAAAPHGGGSAPSPPRRPSQQPSGNWNSWLSGNRATGGGRGMTPSASASSIGYASTAGSKGSPVCLICLDAVTPEELESGEAIQLECQCRGEASLRHVACARKWNKVKGNRICEVCNFEILNLPAPTPPESEAADEEHNRAAGGWGVDVEEMTPGPMDYVYDFFKIVWVVMILCVLFFDLPFIQSLYIGLGAGLGVIVLVRVFLALHAAWLHREMELIEEQVRERRQQREQRRREQGVLGGSGLVVEGGGSRHGRAARDSNRPQRTNSTPAGFSVRIAYSP